MASISSGLASLNLFSAGFWISQIERQSYSFILFFYSTSSVRARAFTRLPFPYFELNSSKCWGSLNLAMKNGLFLILQRCVSVSTSSKFFLQNLQHCLGSKNFSMPQKHSLSLLFAYLSNQARSLPSLFIFPQRQINDCRCLNLNIIYTSPIHNCICGPRNITNMEIQASKNSKLKDKERGREGEREKVKANINSDHKRQKNNYKALYKMSRELKGKAQQQSENNQHFLERKDQFGEEQNHSEDSLENLEASKHVANPHKKKGKIVINFKGEKSHQNSNNSLNKKRSHNRSHSCPFIAPLQSSMSLSSKAERPKMITHNKKQHEGESKRTLKKKSAQFYLKHQKHHNNIQNNQNNHNWHRKNAGHLQKSHHKSSASHLSQQSNTIIVHTLPIEQLSSMLYSSNNLNKKNLNESCSQKNLAKQIFSIHNDMYFQTRLQQQIKMYNLNEEMKTLQKETENVRIKQEVLEKLANELNINSLHQENEDEEEECDDSLLIHS